MGRLVRSRGRAGPPSMMRASRDTGQTTNLNTRRTRAAPAAASQARPHTSNITARRPLVIQRARLVCPFCSASGTTADPKTGRPAHDNDDQTSPPIGARVRPGARQQANWNSRASWRDLFLVSGAAARREHVRSRSDWLADGARVRLDQTRKCLVVCASASARASGGAPEECR